MEIKVADGVWRPLEDATIAHFGGQAIMSREELIQRIKDDGYEINDSGRVAVFLGNDGSKVCYAIENDGSNVYWNGRCFTPENEDETNDIVADCLDDAVYARKRPDGPSGQRGILENAASGHEDKMDPHELRNKVAYLQAISDEGELSRKEWLADSEGQILRITLRDCERYLEAGRR